MEACPFDPCKFVLREDSHIPGHPDDHPDPKFHAKGKIVGILGIHVDDGIGGGGEKFQKVVKLLEQKYPFGSKKSGTFTFTGVDMTQQGDYSIALNQSAMLGKYPQSILTQIAALSLT